MDATPEGEIKDRDPILATFLRSQATSLMSTSVDFASYGLLFYIINIHYAYASIIGNICGAIVSFSIGRYWAFKSTEDKLFFQALRYIITSISSAIINTYCIILVTEKLGWEPTFSKVIVSFVTGISFNFLMFRYFVYRK